MVTGVDAGVRGLSQLSHGEPVPVCQVRGIVEGGGVIGLGVPPPLEWAVGSVSLHLLHVGCADKGAWSFRVPQTDFVFHASLEEGTIDEDIYTKDPEVGKVV